MSIIPAVLVLLCQGAGWRPRWLDGMLPTVDIEGAGLDEGAAETRLPHAPGAGTT